MRSKLAASLVLACTFATTAPAATLFQDGFAGDIAANGGGSQLQFTGFSNWTVTGTGVDLVASANPYGITCVGCVDLAGTPGPGGIVSKPIAISAGVKTTVQFQVSGNQRTGATDPFTAGVTFTPGNGGTAIALSGPASFTTTGPGGYLDMLNGSPYQESIVGGRSFLTYSYYFIAFNSGTFQLSFASNGPLDNENIGPLVQNVSVTAVPEPATWAMMILGFGMVGFAARRRTLAHA